MPEAAKVLWILTAYSGSTGAMTYTYARNEDEVRKDCKQWIAAYAYLGTLEIRACPDGFVMGRETFLTGHEQPGSEED